MGNKTFIPGSEWIYFKLYTGTKTADTILTNSMSEYIRVLKENDFIDKWFFIRYTDPDFHIRLRLHLKESRNFTAIFNHFYESFLPLVDTGLIWNIQCDTYQREMVRYGDKTISLVEDLFFNDSEHIICLLQRLDNENPDQHRWKLAIVLIDSYLAAFSFDLHQRKNLLNQMAENYKKEFGFVHHQITKQLNDKCRACRKDIENAMLWKSEISEVMSIVKDRQLAIYPIAKKITTMKKAGELQVSLNELLTSLIHMTMNRWFRAKNRLHEMVIYEFLSRYYTSEIAKNNKNSLNEANRRNCSGVDY